MRSRMRAERLGPPYVTYVLPGREGTVITASWPSRAPCYTRRSVLEVQVRGVPEILDGPRWVAEDEGIGAVNLPERLMCDAVTL